MGYRELYCLTRSITMARSTDTPGTVSFLPPQVSAMSVLMDLNHPWYISELLQLPCDPHFKEAGWILDWGLSWNTNLPGNYFPAVWVKSIVFLSAGATWKWSAAVLHLCRSCIHNLFPLSPCQLSLAWCCISGWPFYSRMGHMGMSGIIGSFGVSLAGSQVPGPFVMKGSVSLGSCPESSTCTSKTLFRAGECSSHTGKPTLIFLSFLSALSKPHKQCPWLLVHLSYVW